MYNVCGCIQIGKYDCGRYLTCQKFSFFILTVNGRTFYIPTFRHHLHMHKLPEELAQLLKFCELYVIFFIEKLLQNLLPPVVNLLQCKSFMSNIQTLDHVYAKPIFQVHNLYLVSWNHKF